MTSMTCCSDILHRNVTDYKSRRALTNFEKVGAGLVQLLIKGLETFTQFTDV